MTIFNRKKGCMEYQVVINVKDDKYWHAVEQVSYEEASKIFDELIKELNKTGYLIFDSREFTYSKIYIPKDAITDIHIEEC